MFYHHIGPTGLIYQNSFAFDQTKLILLSIICVFPHRLDLKLFVAFVEELRKSPLLNGLGKRLVINTATKRFLLSSIIVMIDEVLITLIQNSESCRSFTIIPQLPRLSS